MSRFKQSEHTLLPAASAKPDFMHKSRHDIRDALHVVIGMSRVLAISGDMSPAQKEVIDTLQRNADHALELVEDLCDYFQSPTPKAVPQENESRQKAQPPVIPAMDKVQPALLVEDSIPNVQITTAFLKELGYSWDVANNGQQALDKFSTGSYSVIIMDVQMPGMDGLETARRMRALEKKRNIAPTPILATTGNATEDDKLFCMKAGMNDYLSKPFDLEGLERKLCAIKK